MIDLEQVRSQAYGLSCIAFLIWFMIRDWTCSMIYHSMHGMAVSEWFGRLRRSEEGNKMDLPSERSHDRIGCRYMLYEYTVSKVCTVHRYIDI